ncbi:HEAT repeat domain-containing protein [Oxynema sp. CENA135]|jgi:HEAT repeat protein|uniref:HEAT repeat domain-containing protein n=1 Tax=Oxynema aestuarii AP17 TaxID=2064643 RepID=A0A6H1TXW2_9CYAN|nr:MULTISPECIES: HEAT repeat domain-containing protein [Oxynema]MBK4730015.1 HEAT repeat domain-containing protein [Oxynema sp. CENA135]QIZ71421.1 HEAT repeat domain-containing protein [Oxynema aestuarii AP17]RMH77049.1 MAG: HEAT repeat domain-containing protein [Cyanobacteria bacterium J007]
MSITPESVKTLLQSEDLGDRIKGVNQLRQLDRATAFDLVQGAIGDRSPRIRYAAVSQMAHLGVENRELSLTVLRDRLLNDSEADVQSAAADALGALQLTEAFDELRHLYETTQEWLLKFSIVAALGELGDDRSFEILEDALKSDEELVKTAAISSLGELGDRRATPLLLPFATDPDWQIRHRLAQALGRLGGDEVRATLETLAEDEVDLVGQTARSYL